MLKDRPIKASINSFCNIFLSKLLIKHISNLFPVNQIQNIAHLPKRGYFLNDDSLNSIHGIFLS